jgi:hypothetical protein
VAGQNRADIGMAYQAQGLYWDDDSESMPVGLNFDVAGKIARHLSAVGQVDWSHTSESLSANGLFYERAANFTTFGGGIRWSTTANSNVTPFLQGLFGATHHQVSSSVPGEGEFSSALTYAMVQVGGGVAFPLSGHLGGVAQFDYRRIFATDQGVDSIRGVFGIRWMFK